MKSLNVPDTFIEKKKDGDKEIWKTSFGNIVVGGYTASVRPRSWLFVTHGVCGWKRRFLMCGRACCVLSDVGWRCWGGV